MVWLAAGVGIGVIAQSLWSLWRMGWRPWR